MLWLVQSPLVDLLPQLHAGSPRPSGDEVDGCWHVLGASAGGSSSSGGLMQLQMPTPADGDEVKPSWQGRLGAGFGLLQLRIHIPEWLQPALVDLLRPLAEVLKMAPHLDVHMKPVEHCAVSFNPPTTRLPVSTVPFCNDECAVLVPGFSLSRCC